MAYDINGGVMLAPLWPLATLLDLIDESLGLAAHHDNMLQIFICTNLRYICGCRADGLNISIRRHDIRGLLPGRSRQRPESASMATTTLGT
jgi:hypothetical protein